MYEITAPTGRRILIPSDAREDAPYFPAMTPEAVAYYRREGYVVLRGVTPKAICAQVRESFAAEVKPYTGPIYRQTTAQAERNKFNDHGHMMNPIQNLQDLDRRHFSRLRTASLDALTNPALVKALSALFGETPKLIQSMYFDGNPVTWPHQDSYYQDAEDVGGQAAAWVALEDINPGAGRFYVCPRSHRIDMAMNGGEFDIAFNHDRYKEFCLQLIERNQLEVRAPALSEGDVLIWNARTMHGSLPTVEMKRTRQSLTAHYIPESSRMLQFHARIKPMTLQRYRDILIHCPKDQARLVNRLILWLEDRLPGPFYALKRLAIKAIAGKGRSLAG